MPHPHVLLFTFFIKFTFLAAASSDTDNAIIPHALGSQWLLKTQEILGNMNDSIDPCENFFEFACGRHGEDSVLSQLFYINEEHINELLQSEDSADLKESDTVVKSFYRSCSNSKGFQREALLRLISEFGQMPALVGEKWREQEFDWIRLIGQIKYKFGNAILFHVKYAPDFWDNSITRIALTQPECNLHGGDSELKSYYYYLYAAILEFLGLSEEAAQQEAKEVLAFALQLLHFMQDDELMAPSKFYTLATMEEVQQKYADLWNTSRLVEISLGVNNISTLMLQSAYVDQVFRLLQNTSQRVLGNFIYLQYISEYLVYVNEDFQIEQPLCALLTADLFGGKLENMLYRKYFSAEDKHVFLAIWPELRATLADFFQTSPRLDWMSPASRQRAGEKLMAMQLKLDTYEDIDYDVIYKDLVMEEHNLLGNIYRLLELRGRRARSLLARAVPNFSVSYSPHENVAHIPVRYLQANVTGSQHFAAAFNFGHVGFYLGHEILHGFDENGRYFDGHGNGRSWLDDESLKGLHAHSHCLAEQYTNFTFEGHHLPAIETQAENMADNGGLHLAYSAYAQWYATKSTKEQRLRESLKDTNYTHSQLFFIANAQSMCSRTSSNDNLHYPSMTRIRGMISNSEDFARAFACPLGSPMNPARKCQMY